MDHHGHHMHGAAMETIAPTMDHQAMSSRHDHGDDTSDDSSTSHMMSMFVSVFTLLSLNKKRTNFIDELFKNIRTDSTSCVF